MIVHSGRGRRRCRALVIMCVMATLWSCIGSTEPQTSYPGGGQLIVFSSTRDKNAEIYSMRPDGSDVRRLTNNGTSDIEPSLSPDRSRIAFTTYHYPYWRVYVMNVDGSGAHEVSPSNNANNSSPSWSPDGRHIAFESDLYPPRQIWIIDADGGHPHFLAFGFSPSWGPRRIAFTGDREEFGTLCSIDPEGGPASCAAIPSLIPIGVNWSPDGSRLVFSANDPANLSADVLYTVNADGTGLEQLLNNVSPAEDAEPVWSPDGTRILFESDRGGSYFGLFTANIDGSDIEQLTFGPRGDGEPNWR